LKEGKGDNMFNNMKNKPETPKVGVAVVIEKTAKF